MCQAKAYVSPLLLSECIELYFGSQRKFGLCVCAAEKPRPRVMGAGDLEPLCLPAGPVWALWLLCHIDLTFKVENILECHYCIMQYLRFLFIVMTY